jgi:hypothetical protein
MYLTPEPFRPDTFSQYGYADAAGNRALARAYGHDRYPRLPTAYEGPAVLAGLGALPTRSQQETLRRSAKKPVLTKARVTVSSSGKVTVPTSSFWSDWNRQTASSLAPILGAFTALPLPTAIKTKFRTRPLDALLDLFDPVEDAVGRAVDRVIAKKGFKQNYFGETRDVRRVHPIDKRADNATQNLMRRLRTMDSFIVLIWTQPVDLAAEMAREGINIVANVAKNVTNAAEDAFTALKRAFGVGGLGDGGVVTAPTAAGAVTTLAASLGVVLDVALVEAIFTIVSMITGGLATAAGAAALLTPAEKESLPPQVLPGTSMVRLPGASVPVRPAASSSSSSSMTVPLVVLAALVGVVVVSH